MEICINFGTGQMVIDLRRFFPTTKRNLIKLLKVVDMDIGSRCDLYDSLIDFCKSEKVTDKKRTEQYSKHIELLTKRK